MYAFNYAKPGAVEEAAQMLRDLAEPKVLAGGQTLIPTMKQRLAMPSDLVDVSALPEMKGISVEGGKLIVGAAEKHADVAASDTVRAEIPALAELASLIGDPHVRHMGTLGGSLANNDPSADYPAAALGLGAEVVTSKRTIPADEFFLGMFETALEPDELIVRVAFPKPEKAAYKKFPNPASRYALVGVFVAKFASGVRVAVTGAGPSVRDRGGAERGFLTAGRAGRGDTGGRFAERPACRSGLPGRCRGRHGEARRRGRQRLESEAARPWRPRRPP